MLSHHAFYLLDEHLYIWGTDEYSLMPAGTTYTPTVSFFRNTTPFLLICLLQLLLPGLLQTYEIYNELFRMFDIICVIHTHCRIGSDLEHILNRSGFVDLLGSVEKRKANILLGKKQNKKALAGIELSMFWLKVHRDGLLKQVMYWTKVKRKYNWFLKHTKLI